MNDKHYILTSIGKAEIKARYGKDGKPIVRDGIDVLARHLKSRLKQDHQNVIVIDGGTGSGKSNLAIHLALALNPKWRLEDGYIYDDQDLKDKLKNLHDQYPVFLMDEGSIILNSKNSLCSEDKGIIALFDTMRYLHITTIICCPNAQKLNKTLLTDHVNYRLICPKKAPIRGYDARGFVHVHGKWSATWTDSTSWPFIFTTAFPKMSKAMELRYNVLKQQSSKRIMEKILC